MTIKRPQSILDRVDILIEEWLGISGNALYGKTPLRSKQALIDLSENTSITRPALEMSNDLIVGILQQIEDNYKAMGEVSPSPNNWQWVKSPQIDHGFTSEERIPEETLVQVLGDDWVNQVPVCDGLAKRRECPRGIGLIHRSSDYKFEFIELKYGTERQGYGSDTPLVAAMEILQYALVYLFSRKKRLYGGQRGKENLLAAKAIHLIVLAPAGYYTYKTKRGMIEYDLQWIEVCLNKGLRDYRAKHGKSLPAVDFHFQILPPEFEELYQPLKAAINRFRKAGVSQRKNLCP